MTFSERNGFDPVSKPLQAEYMDIELRNRLWNIVYSHVLKAIPLFELNGHRTYSFDAFTMHLWQGFFKLPIDEQPKQESERIKYINESFYSYSWNRVYDFLEFLLSFAIDGVDSNAMCHSLNTVLRQENAIWSVVDRKIIPLSSPQELESVSTALTWSGTYGMLRSANTHLSNALKALSRRDTSSYRDSIQQSFSAVEAFARQVTGENDLGKALSSLERRGIVFNTELRKGFEKMYHWTNHPETGIRHAVVTDPVPPDQYDATYMLVTCSAFINFLVGKAIKSGFELK